MDYIRRAKEYFFPPPSQEDLDQYLIYLIYRASMVKDSEQEYNKVLSLIDQTLEAGANPDTIENDRSPVLFSAINLNLPFVVGLLLIKYGANINITRYGLTPLQNAIMVGSLPMVKQLISVGADVQARGQKGLSPLVLAIHKDDVDIVEYLIEKGADPLKSSGPGWNSVIFSKSDQVRDLLIEHGAWDDRDLDHIPSQEIYRTYRNKILHLSRLAEKERNRLIRKKLLLRIPDEVKEKVEEHLRQAEEQEIHCQNEVDPISKQFISIHRPEDIYQYGIPSNTGARKCLIEDSMNQIVDKGSLVIPGTRERLDRTQTNFNIPMINDYFRRLLGKKYKDPTLFRRNYSSWKTSPSPDKVKSYRSRSPRVLRVRKPRQ